MGKMKFNLGLALALAVALVALPGARGIAQQAVVTTGSSASSGDASGTIASTNVWQQVWPQASAGQPRHGCLVLNNDTTRAWVYFGASPSKAAAVPLEPATATNAAGGWVSCATGTGATLQDQVWVTGTSGSQFIAKQQ